MRLVHAADLHLDSPLRGLTRLGDDTVAQALRAATRRALENLVQLVIDERVPVLLLAGDVYDGDWNDYGTGRFFTEQMRLLQDADVRVIMISGNHDAESEITRSLRLPANVTVLDVARPVSVEVEGQGLVVHGQGFATRAVLANLAAAYPDRVPGLVNVGLLHASVGGDPRGHERYAPCALPDLLAKGYEYFALGHIHRRAVLHEGEHTVAYSGNLQGRHPQETGPKGALVIDLEPGGVPSVQFRAVDVARWERVQVPVDTCNGLDQALDAVDEGLRRAVTSADGRFLVARVVLTGRSPAAADLADSDRVREEIFSLAGRAGATVERIEVQVEPPLDLEPVEDSLAGAIRSAADAWSADPAAVRAQLQSLDRELGRQLREAGLLNLADSSTLMQIAARAAASLQAQLAGGVR
jgi:exonuclease SbcD